MVDRPCQESHGQASPKRASVIVMTFNRPIALGRCLQSLASQSLDSREFEVLVLDVSDEPANGIVAGFRGRLDVVHRRAPNLGVASNRNAGAAMAHGPVLAFLDDDCVASPDWLRTLVEAVERDPSTMVGCRTVLSRPDSATAAAGQVITEAVDAFFNPPDRPARFLPGLNFAISRDRYLALGGCDAAFGFLAAEDRDLVDRWLRSGGALRTCPGAEVVHEHRSSLRGFVRQYFNYGRGAWRYHRLRRKRGHGRMSEDLGLHLGLPTWLAGPLGRMTPTMRAKVLMLVGVWQAANLAGFCFQAAVETFAPGDGEGHG